MGTRTRMDLIGQLAGELYPGNRAEMRRSGANWQLVEIQDGRWEAWCRVDRGLRLVEWIYLDEPIGRVGTWTRTVEEDTPRPGWKTIHWRAA